MLRILRYIGLGVWVVCMTALPLTFILLHWMGGDAGAMPPAAVGAVVFGVSGLLWGLGVDFWGGRRIQALIKEGEQWERAGVTKRAQNAYTRAVAVFDSAWISPMAARRTGPVLMASVARFYLVSPILHSGFERAAALYLMSRPEDRTLTRLWLEKEGGGRLDPALIQSVLSALADVHFADPKIAPRLAVEFLRRGRTDFSARRLYGHVLGILSETPMSRSAAALKMAITDLTGEAVTDSDKELTGGDSRLWTLKEQRNGAWTEAGNSEAGGDIISPVSTVPRLRPSMRLARGFSGGLRSMARMGALCWDRAGRTGRAFVRLIKEQAVRRLIKTGLIGGGGLCLAAFVWTTLSHVFEPPVQEPARRIEVPISKPYTIQVAAYLKSDHARGYVAVLRKKGIAATVKTTDAGGKVWFLVRVSEFMDKKTAAEFGNRLKDENIIDDFFVSNK